MGSRAIRTLRSAALAACLPVSLAARELPDAEAVGIMRKGVRAYQEARLEDAEALLSRAIRLFPGWKTASGFRAMVRREMGDLSSARSDARLAATMRPDGAESQAARGMAWLALGDPDSAAGDLAAAARRNPGYVPARLGLGAAWKEAGLADRAMGELSRAAAIDPDSAMALILRGETRLSLQDAAGARDDFGRAIALNPLSARAWEGRGRASAAAGETERAMADLSRASSLDPARRERLEPLLARLSGSRPSYPAYANAQRYSTDSAGEAAAGERLLARAPSSEYESDYRDAPSSRPAPAIDEGRRREVSRDIMRRYGYTGVSQPEVRVEYDSDVRDAVGAPALPPSRDYSRSSSGAVSELGRSIRQRWVSLRPRRRYISPVAAADGDFGARPDERMRDALGPEPRRPSRWRRWFGSEDEDLPETIY